MEQLRGKHVLIVEDVIQTGKTLQKVTATAAQERGRSGREDPVRPSVNYLS